MDTVPKQHFFSLNISLIYTFNWGMRAKVVFGYQVGQWFDIIHVNSESCVSSTIVQGPRPKSLTGWVVRSRCLSDMKCIVMIWRSWVRIPVRWNLECVVLLSKLYLNYKYQVTEEKVIAKCSLSEWYHVSCISDDMPLKPEYYQQPWPSWFSGY